MYDLMTKLIIIIIIVVVLIIKLTELLLMLGQYSHQTNYRDSRINLKKKK